MSALACNPIGWRTTETGREYDQRWVELCETGVQPSRCWELGVAFFDSDLARSMYYFDRACFSFGDAMVCSAAAKRFESAGHLVEALRYAAHACSLREDRCLQAAELAEANRDPAAASYRTAYYGPPSSAPTIAPPSAPAPVVATTLYDEPVAEVVKEKDCSLMTRWRDADALRNNGEAQADFAATLSHIATTCYDNGAFKYEECAGALQGCLEEGWAVESDAATHDIAGFLADIEGGWEDHAYPAKAGSDLYTIVDGSWSCDADPEMMTAYATSRAAIALQYRAIADEWTSWYGWAGTTCANQAAPRSPE